MSTSRRTIPKSQAQLCQLVRVYEELGPVRHRYKMAADAVGVSESTARRRITQYYAAHEDEAVFLPRTRRTPPSKIRAIWTLYYRLPEMERVHSARRIAGTLTARGDPISHPTVAAILAQPPPDGFPPPNMLKLASTDDLIAHLRRGILASERDNVDTALDLLYLQVWRHLDWTRGPSGRAAWTEEIEDPSPRGIYLLKSRIQTAHMLVTSGNQAYARPYTRDLLRWMSEHEDDRSLWGGWSRVAERDSATSLERDALWCDIFGVHAQAHRSDYPARAMKGLREALMRLECGERAAKTGQRLSPALCPYNANERIGRFESLLSLLELKTHRGSEPEMRTRFSDARRRLEMIPCHLAVATLDQARLDSVQADVHSPRETQRRLSAAVRAMFGYLDQLDEGNAVRAILTIDAAGLLLKHRMADQIDKARLLRAIAQCARIGMASHVRKALYLPGMNRLLPSDTVDAFKPLTRFAHI